MEVADGGRPLRIRSQVAEAPTGDTEDFGEAGDGDGALRHAGERGQGDMLCAVVKEVLIHLVGEDEKVVLQRERGERFELGAGEDFAAGVGGSVQDDAPGLRRDGGAETIHIERPIGSCQRHDHWLHT